MNAVCQLVEPVVFASLQFFTGQIAGCKFRQSQKHS